MFADETAYCHKIGRRSEFSLAWRAIHMLIRGFEMFVLILVNITRRLVRTSGRKGTRAYPQVVQW